MTSLYRVRAEWTGFSGGPGVSTFYFLDAATCVNSLVTFFDSVKSFLPSDVHIAVGSTGDIIEDTTGVLTGAWGADPVSDVVGTAPYAYAAPVGCMVGWETGTILDSHRLRGKTFLVPLTGAAFDTDGTLKPDTVSGCLGAGEVLIADQSTSFVIWHRPRAAKAADGSRKAITARTGGHGLITTCRVPDKAVVLRSRRD